MMGIPCFERNATEQAWSRAAGLGAQQCLGHVRTSAPGGSAGLGQRPGRGEPQLRAVQKSAKRVLNPGVFLLMAKSERESFQGRGRPNTSSSSGIYISPRFMVYNGRTRAHGARSAAAEGRASQPGRLRRRQGEGPEGRARVGPATATPFPRGPGCSLPARPR